MNKLLSLLLGIILIEIVLGYSLYQSNISKLTGNKISSIFYFMEKYQINSREKLKISNELENNTTQKKKQDPNNSNSTKENNKMESLDCNKYLNLNAEFNIFSTRYLRHSLKLQSTLKFMNNVDISDSKYAILNADILELYQDELLSNKNGCIFKITNDDSDSFIRIEDYVACKPPIFQLYYNIVSKRAPLRVHSARAKGIGVLVD